MLLRAFGPDSLPDLSSVLISDYNSADEYRYEEGCESGGHGPKCYYMYV
jgi:hypothetical protein